MRNTQKINRNGKQVAKDAVMSVQHLFAMMGATILVPILANMNVSITLISAGVGTIIFYFVTKKKVPVFLGSSFAFLSALMATLGSAGAIGSDTWNIAMAKTAIAIVCTGMVYVLISLIIKCLGTGFIKKLFPPIVVGPVIIVIGMVLSGSAVNNIFNTANASTWYDITGKALNTYLTVAYLVTALVTTGTIVVFAVFMKGFLKVVPILAGLIAGYLTALAFGIINFGVVESAGWILFQPSELKKAFGWYGVLFSKEVWSEVVPVILLFVPIAIVTFMEHLGDINASSVVCGKDFINDPGIHRTLLGDGLATMAAGVIGGPCNTTYGENTAVLAITKNYNPKLLVQAGVIAIFLGILSKVGAVIGTIPSPVIGGASLILYGMIAANGLKTIIEAKVDFSDSKNLIICSIILVVGIGMSSAGRTLDIGILSFSPLSVATIIGILLNVVFMLSKGKQSSGLSATYSDLETKENEKA